MFWQGKREWKLTIPFVQTLTIKPFFIPLSQYPVERPMSLNIAQTHKYTKSAQKTAVLRRRQFKQETSAISTLPVYITRVPLQYCVVALLSLSRSETCWTLRRTLFLKILWPQAWLAERTCGNAYWPSLFLIAKFTYSRVSKIRCSGKRYDDFNRERAENQYQNHVDTWFEITVLSNWATSDSKIALAKRQDVVEKRILYMSTTM